MAQGHQIENAVRAIHGRGEYPSATRINKQLGRKTRTLNGKECEARRRVFRELGIDLKGPVQLAEASNAPFMQARV